MAPYLSLRPIPNLSDSAIGIIIAVQVAISSLLGGLCGNIADEWERQNPNHGRLNILKIGIIWGVACFITEIIGNNYIASNDDFVANNTTIGSESEYRPIFYWWNLCLRSGYAVSVALTMPVLDGEILAHLKRESSGGNGNGNIGSEEYGKERVHGEHGAFLFFCNDMFEYYLLIIVRSLSFSYMRRKGAIWWGLASAAIGIACDKMGYDAALISMALVASTSCLILIYFYERQQSSLTSYNEECRHLKATQSDEGYTSCTSSMKCSVLEQTAEQVPNNVNDVDPYSLMKLIKISFSSTHRIAFFVVFGLLNIGMAVVENLIFLFYQNYLGSSKTM